MKASRLVSLCMLVGASSAYAQDSADLYPVNTTVRDYAKRDRLLLGGLDYVSPSQLHENAGLRGRVEAEVQNSELRKQGEESDLTTPSATAALAYGWRDLTFGLKGTYLKAENEGDGDGAVKEEFEVTKFEPELAYTFGKYFTAGIGAEITTLDVTEELATENDFDYEYTRGIAGLSYHEPAFEIGVAYTTEVQEEDSLGAGDAREGSLSLAPAPQDNERAIYLPAMGTLFARGNVSDNVSIASSVSMARYDGNVQGSVNLFEQYDGQDRVAAKLVGTYWTDARSRFSIAGEYKGAATTAVGAEEAGLGYRLANLYGGSVEGILAINRMAYLGLNASYLRGERGDTVTETGERYTAKEETSKFAGFVTVKL